MNGRATFYIYHILGYLSNQYERNTKSTETPNGNESLLLETMNEQNITIIQHDCTRSLGFPLIYMYKTKLSLQ